MPAQSTREAALKNQCGHQFIPKIGYIACSSGEALKSGPLVGRLCLPEAGSVDGSSHLLEPPGGGEPQRFTWNAAERAWAPQLGQGRRMAFGGTYLASHGWTYLRPVS